MKKIIILLVIFISFSFAKIKEGEIFLIKTTVQPVLNGKIDENCWQEKVELINNEEGKIKEKTDVSITYDEKNLYFSFECFESQIKNLVKNTVIRDEETIEQDDCIKIFIDPYNKADDFYQIIINAQGVILDKFVHNKEENILWNANIEVVSSIEKEKWCLEIKIPFESFSITPYVTSIWRINLLRIRQAKEYSAQETSVFVKTKEIIEFGKLNDIKINFGIYTRLNIQDKIRLLQTSVTDEKLKIEVEELNKQLENIEPNVEQDKYVVLWNKIEKILEICKKEKKIGFKHEKYITPAIKWANPYYQRKIKTLFITLETSSREVIEIEQRLSLEYDICGPTDVELSTLLKEKEYDLIVVSGLGTNSISIDNQKLIADQIKNGCGLIYINPYYVAPELGELLPVSKVGTTKKEGVWQKTKEHFITRGIPFDILPLTSYVSYKTSSKVIATIDEQPLIIISKDEVGKGRIVIFTFNEKESKGILPIPNNKVLFPYWEYYYSLICKTILWTTRLESITLIEDLKPSQTEIFLDDIKKIKIEVLLKNYAELFNGILYISLKDEDGNEEFNRIEKIKMSRGKGIINFEIPQLSKCGFHFVDAILKQRDKIIDWASCVYKIKENIKIEEISIEKENYKPGEIIKGNINFKNIKDGYININIKDATGKIIESITQKISKEQISFALSLNNIHTSLNKIEVKVYDKNNILHDKLSKNFIVCVENTFDDYKIIMWSSDQYKRLPEYLQPYYFKRLKEMGCDTVMDYKNKFDVIPFLENNLDFFIENVVHIGLGDFDSVVSTKKNYESLILDYTEEKTTSYLMRSPCLSDPLTLSKIKDRIKEIVDKKSKYNPLFYSIGDENSITYLTRTFDFCFSPYCLKKFREWLKIKYQTIEDLNNEWGTNFSKWEEVVPITYEKIIKKEKKKQYPNYSQWADHRTFMEDVFVNTIDFCSKYLKELDPKAKVGILGGQKPSCYGGYDWWKLVKVLDVAEVYNECATKEIIRSFNKKCKILSSEFGVEGKREDYVRFHNLLHGDTGLILFSDPQYINFNLELEKSAEYSKNTFSELKSGIAKLLANVERKKSEIAIHYSQASIHAAWIKNPVALDKWSSQESLFEKARVGLVKIIEDLGLQYDFISYEEIEQGKLQNYKVFIMPNSYSVSYKEKIAIEEFTKNGGMVIGDVKTGMMDEHCKTLESGLLNNLFGIKYGEKKTPVFEKEKKETKEKKQETPEEKEEIKEEKKIEEEKIKNFQDIPSEKPNYEKENLYHNNKEFHQLDKITKEEKKDENTIKIIDTYEKIDLKGQNLPLEAEEYDLQTTTGKAIGDFGKIPCIIINQFGNGKAVYLNFNFSFYKDIRYISDLKSEQIRNLFKELFGSMGIENKIGIYQYHQQQQQNSIPNCEIITFEEIKENEKVEYMAILKDYFFCKEQDSLGNIEFVPKDSSLKNGLTDIKIKLPKKTFVYDIREKKSYGETDVITTNFDLSGVKIYALMPYEIKNIEFEFKPICKQGEIINYEIKLKSTNNKIFTHIINLEIFDPHGVLYYSKNILVKDRIYKDVYKWPFNEKIGIWKFILTDVATGTKITKEIELREK